MKKKLTALLLTLILLLQLVPWAAAASTVSFRLIGADKQGNYIVWIPEDTYPINKLSTVGDVLKTAAEQAGLTLTGLETDYISAITAPEALGGYTMSEFTNGANSGWMYTLNGKHPGYSVNTRALKDGDVVIFHYVNNYMYEVEDWSGGYSLGTEEDWNHWLDADDSWLRQEEEAPEPDTEEQQPAEEEKPSEEQPAVSASVEDLIAAIEELQVTKANRATRKRLQNMEKAYEDLSEEEREQVSNLEHLEALRSTFDDLLEDAARDALDDLEEYRDDLDKDEYTDEAWDEIKELFDDAEEDVEDAEDTDELDDILSDVKKDLRAVDGEEEPEVPTVTFVDVQEQDWFYEDVSYAVAEGLFNGTSETTFDPDTSMTRAMLVTVLYRLAGEPSVAVSNTFVDVQEAQWYTNAVIWAAGNGIVNGYGSGLFGTEDPITREQLAAILYRYAAKQLFDVSGMADLSAYTDVHSVSSYSLSAMQWANHCGLINGRTADTLAPTGTATRAEVAAMIHRFAENF